MYSFLFSLYRLAASALAGLQLLNMQLITALDDCITCLDSDRVVGIVLKLE
jgi:hypothetical protein